MSAKKVNRLDFYLMAIISTILLLSAINIHNFLKPVKTEVLGTASGPDDSFFWQEFLNKNPDYIPGWVELGRRDRALQIDPNYFTP